MTKQLPNILECVDYFNNKKGNKSKSEHSYYSWNLFGVLNLNQTAEIVAQSIFKLNSLSMTNYIFQFKKVFYVIQVNNIQYDFTDVDVKAVSADFDKAYVAYEQLLEDGKQFITT